MTRNAKFPALLLVVACTAADESAPDAANAIVPIESPTGVQSGEPNLAVGAGGRVYLSWLERKTDSSVALHLAFREDGQWSAPATVTQRSDLFVNWADFPSVFVAPSGRIVMHWLQKRPGGRYTYDVYTRQSTDAGATWSEPRVLHDDNVAAEHGFVTFYASGPDSIEAVWLDGRATAAAGHGAQSALRGAMQLGTTHLGADGVPAATTLIDDRICDCCQTSAAMTSRGPVVVYRDRSPDEIRDIAILRRVNGTWTQPARVHADEWHIEGCPVNGPSVVAQGDTVAVAWFTGARDTARVNVAFSADAGATFGAPIRVDDGLPVGRVDVEFDGAGRALVTWLERVGTEGAEVRLKSVRASGGLSPVITVARSSAARTSGFPRMVRSGDEVMFAWTVPGDSARIQLATMRVTPRER